MDIFIEENNSTKRIDKFIHDYLYELPTLEKFKDILSRNFVQDNIINIIIVNYFAVKPSYKLREGDLIQFDLDKIIILLENSILVNKEKNELLPENMPLDIIFENDDYLIINKPSGIPVFPGCGNNTGTLANYVKGYLVGKGVYKSNLINGGLVHRLDKPVNGLIIYAKTLQFQKYIQQRFKEHKVFKVYQAKVDKLSEFQIHKNESIDIIKEQWLKGDIDLSNWYFLSGYIGRSSKNRMRMSFSRVQLNDSQKKSELYLCRTSDYDYLIILKTGRMHQIRASFRYLKMPIIDDTLYNGGRGLPLEIKLTSTLIGFDNFNSVKVIYCI